MNAAMPLRGLVIDDDFGVRSLTGAILTAEGYTIQSAGDALEGLLIARASEHPIDFLVTDFDLGAVTGLDLAAAVRRVFPSIRVLLMSGSVDSSILFAGMADGFLQKPFTATELRAKLEGLLLDPHPAEYAR